MRALTGLAKATPKAAAAIVSAIVVTLTTIFVLDLYGSDSAEAASVVLVDAGDIARCSGTGDEATAKLLDGISGTVFTTGDNAY